MKKIFIAVALVATLIAATVSVASADVKWTHTDNIAWDHHPYHTDNLAWD